MQQRGSVIHNKAPNRFCVYKEIWETEETKGIKILRNKFINTLLFADDQVLSHSGDELQKSSHKLNKLRNKCGMEISTEKTKNGILWPRKIVIDNKIIQGCSLSYEGEKDIDVKIPKFLKITGVINTIFKPSVVQEQTRIQIYNTLALLDPLVWERKLDNESK
jgi:hypothetical protein